MNVERKLGVWMCTALVVGNMIGSGIFMLPAALAPYGMNSVLAWLATSAGAVVLACVFSGLSHAFPEAEGPQAYVRLAFGELASFVLAWGYWIAIWVGNAAIATGTVSYLGSLFPALAASQTAAAVATLSMVWLLTAINIRGTRAAGGVQVVTTVLKLLPLLAIAALGVFLFVTRDERLAWQASAAIPISAGGVTTAAALTLWALLGFESAAVAAERVVDPKRTIPRATVFGTLAVAAIYILSCTTILLILPPEVLGKSGAPFADVASRFWGSGAGHAMAVFAAISGFGALNGWTLLQGEVPLQLARRGVFPALFGRLSRWQTPMIGLCISSGLVSALVLMNFGKSLVEVFTFMILLSTTATLAMYLTCALAVLVLLRNGKLAARGAHAGWLAIAGVLGGLYALWTLDGAGAEAVAWGLVLFAASVPVFYAMRRASSRARAA